MAVDGYWLGGNVAASNMATTDTAVLSFTSYPVIHPSICPRTVFDASPHCGRGLLCFIALRSSRPLGASPYSSLPVAAGRSRHFNQPMVNGVGEAALSYWAPEKVWPRPLPYPVQNWLL